VLDLWLPVLRIALALMWLWTAVVSFGVYPVQDSLALLARVGLHGAIAAIALYAAAALDLALGVLTLAAGIMPAGVAYVGKLIVDAVVAAIDANRAGLGADYARTLELVALDRFDEPGGNSIRQHTHRPGMIGAGRQHGGRHRVLHAPTSRSATAPSTTCAR
jgi:hypothetical protein